MMESKSCYVCGRENTKYRCIACSKSICNVCSINCLDTEMGYSEENYIIGKCISCTEKSNDTSDIFFSWLFDSAYMSKKAGKAGYIFMSVFG